MNEAIKILIITILAELVAGVLLIVLGGFLSKKARWVLTATLGRLLDIDIEYVFRGKREAHDDIREELERASYVDLLTGRGNEIQRDTFAGALESTHKKIRFRILLPITKTESREPDWTLQREQEVGAFDPAYGKGILQKQIDTNVTFLDSYIASGTVELRRFNYPHIGRILITDRVAYFTPYRNDAHGRASCVIKYRRGGEMYDAFRRLFDQMWDQDNYRHGK